MNAPVSKSVADFAAMLDGRQYGDEITEAEETMAFANGLVVVFGYSDDNVELRGAIREEIGAYDGTTFRVDAKGVLQGWADLKDNAEDESEFEAYFARKLAGFKTIKAVWCPPARGMSWAYETDIPHATFHVMEDGETYCEGIVFDIRDIAA